MKYYVTDSLVTINAIFKGFEWDNVEKTIKSYIENPRGKGVKIHAVKDYALKGWVIKTMRACDDGIIFAFIDEDNKSEVTFYAEEAAHDKAYKRISSMRTPPFTQDTRSLYFDDELVEEEEEAEEIIEESYLEKVGIKKRYLELLNCAPDKIEAFFLADDGDKALLLTAVFDGVQKDMVLELVSGTPWDEVWAKYEGQKEEKKRNKLFLGFSPWEVTLDSDQMELANKHYNGPCLVEGGAGTGKTIVGIYRCLHLAENVYTKADGKRILFCTYSKKLSNFVEGRMTALINYRNIDNNVTVSSVDSLLWDAAQALDPTIVSNYSDPAFVERTAERVKEAAESKNPALEDFYFDSIVIDEAQDLSPAKMSMLYALVRTTTDNFMILNDENQRIFTFQSWAKNTGINLQGRGGGLKVNCRTTEQIKNYAQNYYKEKTGKELKDRTVASKLMGEEPTIAQFPYPNEIKPFLLDTLKEYRKEDKHDHLFAVVCNSKSICEDIVAYLKANGNIHASVILNEVVPDQTTGVTVIPAQGVKGLEFDTVFIYNLDQIGNIPNQFNLKPRELQRQERKRACLQYVAMTRGRNTLVVSNVVK